MSVTASGDQGIATISISNGTSSYVMEIYLPAGNASTNQVIYLPDTVGTGDGIFILDGTDSGGTAGQEAAFGSCALDCCIAKKVAELLECDCGCTKCDSTLKKAERVHLLMLGIRADKARMSGDIANNTALIAQMRAKYKKATELCSDSCGCDC